METPSSRRPAMLPATRQQDRARTYVRYPAAPDPGPSLGMPLPSLRVSSPGRLPHRVWAMNRYMLMPFGMPDGDVQCQAMLQTLLNVHALGTDPQQAVEAPRFASYSFPSSFEPPACLPGRPNFEAGIPRATGAVLPGLGHDAEWWASRTWLAGGLGIALDERQPGMLAGGANPGRPGYALGRQGEGRSTIESRLPYF